MYDKSQSLIFFVLFFKDGVVTIWVTKFNLYLFYVILRIYISVLHSIININTFWTIIFFPLKIFLSQNLSYKLIDLESQYIINQGPGLVKI